MLSALQVLTVHLELYEKMESPPDISQGAA